MAIVSQPEMTSDHGVVFTIGLRCNGDRIAIVMPVATDNSTLDKKELCNQAVEDMEDTIMDLLAGCISLSAYVAYSQAVGMDDGFVPRRRDFAPTDYPGTQASTCETSQVAALIVFYSEPADLDVGARIRVGKTFIGGIADADVSGDAVSSGLDVALSGLAQALAEGWTNHGSGGGKWYRVVSAPPKGSNAAELVRTGSWDTRGYTGTQRRRLIPH